MGSGAEQDGVDFRELNFVAWGEAMVADGPSPAAAARGADHADRGSGFCPRGALASARHARAGHSWTSRECARVASPRHPSAPPWGESSS